MEDNESEYDYELDEIEDYENTYAEDRSYLRDIGYIIESCSEWS